MSSAETTIATNFHGTDLYKWHIEVPSIDDMYWRPGVTGRRLRLAFDTDLIIDGATYQWPLYSLHGEADPNNGSDVWQFMANNAGPHGSSVVVTTDDFTCHNYGGLSNGTNLDFCCDDLPTRTRLEGAGPTPRC